jgi:aryl-alcohol dehydrogenase-like predicted oxidoreductase
MEFRFLGRTGLRVSAVAFGTMTFGGLGRFQHCGTVQADEARDHTRLCLDAGVNLFDTADVYSQGLSEEILGQALGKERGDVLVATKMHCAMGDGRNDIGQSRHHIVRACEASLRRLGTDHIDLYQMHGYDGYTDPVDTLRALDDLVRSGKVRYVGCTEYSAWHLMKALAISDAAHLSRFASIQAYYSLLGRELEYEFVPLCVDQGLGILAWSPLAGGFLTGKYRPGQPYPANTRRAAMGDPGAIDETRGFAIVEVLADIANDRKVSSAQVAINYVRSKPGVTSVVLGARNREQLADDLDSADWSLSPLEIARLDDVSDLPLPYPYWNQQRFNQARMSAPEVALRAVRGATTAPLAVGQ